MTLRLVPNEKHCARKCVLVEDLTKLWQGRNEHKLRSNYTYDQCLVRWYGCYSTWLRSIITCHRHFCEPQVSLHYARGPSTSGWESNFWIVIGKILISSVVLLRATCAFPHCRPLQKTSKHGPYSSAQYLSRRSPDSVGGTGIWFEYCVSHACCPQWL